VKIFAFHPERWEQFVGTSSNVDVCLPAEKMIDTSFFLFSFSPVRDASGPSNPPPSLIRKKKQVGLVQSRAGWSIYLSSPQLIESLGFLEMKEISPGIPSG